jgi:glycosyltransferase involved in cell wall biosynthesis
MRIVIAGDFPQHPAHIVGGIEAIIYYTIQRLVDYPDLDIHVVTCEKPGQKTSGVKTSDIQDCGWKTHYLASLRLPHTLTMLTTDRWRLSRVIGDLKPDLVHAHGQAAAYPWAAFNSGIPTLITVHGLNGLEARIDPRGGWLRGRVRAFAWDYIERACLRRARDIIVISPFVEQFIRPLTHANLHQIENPVQAELFQLSHEAIRGRILYVGSIQKRKGLTDLIRAVNMLREELPEVQLRVAGAFMPAYAEYGEQMRRLVAELNLEENVFFLGHQDRTALMEEYRHCAVFCLPSYLEASPVVVAEAMAAACPVVTTMIGSTSHLVVDGENGYRTPPGDPGALVARLREILMDEERQYAMGLAGRKVALARFSPEKAARDSYLLYKQCLSQQSLELVSYC